MTSKTEIWPHNLHVAAASAELYFKMTLNERNACNWPINSCFSWNKSINLVAALLMDGLIFGYDYIYILLGMGDVPF